VSAPLAASGTRLALVGALDLARLIVLARILGPDDFGLFAIAVTAVALVTSLAALAATTTPDGESTWTLGVARGAVLAGLLAASAGPVATLFHEPRATAVLRVLALLPLAQALTPPGAARTFAGPAADTVIAITLAPFIGVWALVAGALGGAAAGAAASYADAAQRPRLVTRGARLRPAFGFGGWLVLAGAILAATDFLLRLAVARRHGAGSLGVFALAAGLAFLPVNAAAEALRTVGVPVYARLVADPAALRRGFRGLVTALAVALVPLYAVLAAAAPDLAADVLGPKWAGAAAVLRVLSVACILGLAADAAVPLFQGLGLPRLVAALALAQLVTVAALAGWLTAEYGLTGSALAWTGAALMSLFVSRALLRRMLGPAPETRHRVGAIVGAGAVAAVVTLAVQGVVNGLAGVVLGMMAGLAAAAGIIWQVDRFWRLQIGADLRVLFPK
jgi:O-antigen/teichoic acid export membrane protein